MILIGNSPSSGSTLLADLLDSVPSFACGGELNIFSHRCSYEDFATIKKKGFCQHHTPATYIIRQSLFKPSSLKDYSIDFDFMLSLLRESETFRDLCSKIEAHYLQIRNRSVWVEKTPQNIHCAELFLEYFPESYFIHIVRDPAYVLRSLIKHRGFPVYIALSVWITSVLFAHKIESNPRFITIRYEDLIQSPFVEVSNILQKAGFTILPDEIEKNYMQNTYRSNTNRLKSWSHSGYGTIGNANTAFAPDEFENELSIMYNLQISNSYAKKYCLPRKSVIEMVNYYGYEPMTISKKELQIDFNSQKLLFHKFRKDIICNDAKLRDFPAYMRPVVNRY